MAAREDFKGAFLKIERADHHIQQFEAIARTYVMDNLKALRPERNPKRWKSRSLGGRIPTHTPTIVGDVIHNLRTSLDHAYCALVKANGGVIQRNTTFPFHKDRQSAEGSLNGHEKMGCAPSKAVQSLIFDTVKPFEDGGSELYALHRLDIADKHHILIATDAVMAIERLDFLDELGRPTGGGIEKLSIVVPYGNQATAIGLDGGMGAKLYGDPRTTFDIRFADGEPFEGESVLNTLKRLAKLTSDTVEALSKL